MRFFIFLAALALSGCSNVGYRATGPHRLDAEQACVHDCAEQQKTCGPKDSACQEDYAACAKRCERWSGLRGGGAVSVEIPGAKH